ncbi:MAG: hypothetical protein CL878_11315 [Dehalococcoidia bacterium]|nr:hypothetical protein [Dehalococcoidia bacterium]
MSKLHRRPRAGARRDPAGRPGDELVIAVVGPLMSLALAAVAASLATATAAGGTTLEPAQATFAYLARVNLLLALFNLIPGFPLDGGRVFRSVAWWLTNSLRRATRIATSVGRVIAFGFILSGGWLLFSGNVVNGLWLILIGWFMDNAASASLRQVVMREQFRDVLVSDMMDPDPPAAEPDMSLAEAVEEYVLRQNVRALPVLAEGRIVGMLTPSDIRQVPMAKWATVRVGEVMGGRGGIKSLSPTDRFPDVLQLLAEGDLNQAPVIAEGRLIGLLNRSNIVRYFQIRDELGVQRWHGRPFFRRREESLFDLDKG